MNKIYYDGVSVESPTTKEIIRKHMREFARKGIKVYVNPKSPVGEFIIKSDFKINYEGENFLLHISPLSWEQVTSETIDVLYLINSYKERQLFNFIATSIDEGVYIHGFTEDLIEKGHNEMLISKGMYGSPTMDSVFRFIKTTKESKEILNQTE